MNNTVKKENRLPREIWAASISLKGLWPEQTVEKRMKSVLARMENVYPFQPDIICLPETVNTSWVRQTGTLAEIAEDETRPGPVTSLLAEAARKHNCYIVCPLITHKEGRYYNSSILLDRQGQIAGVFHKVHPTAYEMVPPADPRGPGITPGAVNVPVFKTDFGTIGMQICADASWSESWQALKRQGAEVVLFPSQASYGQALNHHAWLNHFNIVSSTGEDARIIDIAGDVIAADGEFARWVCAPVNLEKEFIHIWPQTLKFDDIQKKYGRKVRFHIAHAENWATLESLDPDIKVRDILREYGLPTYDEQIKEATALQEKFRL